MISPTLLVLAAGLSSRYGGQSKQTDALGPAGETLLDYSVRDAKDAGFGRVVFIIRREGEAVFRERVVARIGPHLPVTLAYQDREDVPEGFTVPAERTKPWGTGHAVLAAREAVKEPFCVINADDFYGREAFAAMADFLRRTGQPHGTAPAAEPWRQERELPGAAPLQLAMCGYELRRTLSEHGKVARGLCTATPEGQLQSVEELTDIYATASGAENRPPEGPVRALSGLETVSMNMWGFHPQIFAGFREGFADFLRTLPPEDVKSEYYIPLAVDGLLKSGQAVCTVLPTAAQWFGVTYQEDKSRVQSALRKMVENGTYPSPLWGRATAESPASGRAD